MTYQLTVPQWLQVEQLTRIKIAELFNIPKTGQRSFQQIGGVGEVTSDGHTNKDLSALTLEKMNAWLGEECPDIFIAFAKVVERIETPEEVALVPGEFTYDKPLPEVIYPDDKSVPVQDLPKPDDVVKDATLPPCAYCDTKGTRHLKTCTRPV